MPITTSLSFSPSRLADLVDRPCLFPVDPELVFTTSPSIDKILISAGSLWCETATWPTARAIGAEAGLSPSTVISPFSTLDRMRLVLVRAEREAFDRARRVTADLASAAAHRAAQLAAFDERLTRLPMIAAIAVGVDDGDELAALAGAVSGCSLAGSEGS